jgi:hypothetical protein
MNRRRPLAALAATLLLALSACANTTGAGVGSSPNTSPPPNTSPNTSPAGVALSLVRTGGFIGVKDEITVDPSGAWTATDRAGHRRTGQLTDAQLTALRSLAADPRLRQEATRVQGPTKCADVYSYALTVDSMRVNFIDCPTDADRPEAARAIITLVTQAIGT